MADFLLVLDLVVRVRAGFFDAVHLAPPAATWSRQQRNAATEGQLPLRSRSEPFGLSSLKPPRVEKVSQSNREWEAVLWIFEQSAACRVKKVGVLLLFPEDFGGHVSSGPASPWSAREVHNLECASDVRRSSAFLCQLAGTDQRRLVGILTNLPQLKSKLFLHWPSLVRCGDELLYNGPLPISCPCDPQHYPFRERMRRRTSCRLLPNHWASLSGTCVWPKFSTVRSSPLGMADFCLMQLNRLTAIFSFSSGVHSNFSLFFFLAQRFPVTCPPDGYREALDRSQPTWNTRCFSILWLRSAPTLGSLAV